jgi:hypothetical protein
MEPVEASFERVAGKLVKGVVKVYGRKNKSKIKLIYVVKNKVI